MYNDLMIDLETLGQRPGCSVLSIGVVPFTLDEIGDGKYIVVNRQSCLDNGLEEDESTIAWWEQQSEQACMVLNEAADPKKSTHLHAALNELADYVASFNSRSVRIWGNGSDFDNAILAVCYGKAGMKLPWQFWNNRCYRTLKGMDGSKPARRTGTYHNALDDALTQAQHLQEILTRRGWPLA